MSGKQQLAPPRPLAVPRRLGDKFCAPPEKPRMTPQPSTPFRLRDRLVTPARNTIQGPDSETGIEPKIMAVLCVLAGEPGRVFTRAELIDTVWGAEFGADESLTRAISHLRKALGDTRNEPAVIETIAKRGYRLLPGVLSPDTPASPPAATAGAPRLINRRAINRHAWGAGALLGVIGAGALLWFKPFSGDTNVIPVTVLPVNAVRREPSQLSFATALTVDLVGVLAKDKRLHVTVSRPDPNLPKRGRRYSIYADLQTDDGQLKAHVEIMDFDTNQALWSRLYERPYDGKLSSQDELARMIVKDLTAALLTMEQTKP
jgi:DNA-binding winged helix-turn-helix (wHTH) protein/TolB-like protein